MTRQTLLLPLCVFAVMHSFAQQETPDANRKFSPDELRADLSFLKTQVFNAHADPFTELDKPAYERLFAGIGKGLNDSLTATDFYKRVKPAVAWLSDEHAQISLPAALQTAAWKERPLFLPFTLTKSAAGVTIDDVLAGANNVARGTVIAAINGVPLDTLLRRCATYSTGFPEQRALNALRQFGYLYSLASPGYAERFTITDERGKTYDVGGATYGDWLNYLTKQSGWGAVPKEDITYRKIGATAYVDVRAFRVRNDRQMDSLSRVLDGMFATIAADHVKTLVIDVSRNGGGNSAEGDLLIGYFYGKPFRGYQCNWRRSDEYLALMKSWGSADDDYAAKMPGSVLHFDSSVETPPAKNPVRFNGKTYVVVGDGTFSSAMMFATTVKDNHIATIAGVTPKNGHPDHFGEMYGTRLPNTRLALQFGVKEWIRPNGKMKPNELRPDVVLRPADLSSAETIVAALNN